MDVCPLQTPPNNNEGRLFPAQLLCTFVVLHLDIVKTTVIDSGISDIQFSSLFIQNYKPARYAEQKVSNQYINDENLPPDSTIVENHALFSRVEYTVLCFGHEKGIAYAILCTNQIKKIIWLSVGSVDL